MTEPITLTLNISQILGVLAGLTTVFVFLSWVKKATVPVFKPFKTLESKVCEIDARGKKCNAYFENDKKRLDNHDELLKELRADMKIMMESSALLLKHAETGNCTGEVAAGREKLENYLINK